MPKISMDRLSIDRLSIDSVGSYIREQRRNARYSLRQLSALAGVSNPYLSQVERGLRKPSAEILQQIARGLRISSETLYVRAGILDERPGDQHVSLAIFSDPELTEQQKAVLIDIYESFRKDNDAHRDPAADADPASEAVPDPRSSNERHDPEAATEAPSGKEARPRGQRAGRSGGPRRKPDREPEPDPGSEAEGA